MSSIRRIFVEKREGFNVEAKELYHDLYHNLGVKTLENVRILNRYDVSELQESVFDKACKNIFSEPNVDNLYLETFPLDNDSIVFAYEYLPGQYDQRADSASQAVQILTHNVKPVVKYAKTIVLSGKISDLDLNRIKNYCINSVDSREASLEKPVSLEDTFDIPESIEIVDNFINMTGEQLQNFRKYHGLAMNLDDLLFCQSYFKDEEKRNPTITEIKVLDTYWSDHCRHTTFNTILTDIEFEEGLYTSVVKDTYNEYLEIRKTLNRENKDISLMDIAIIGMRYLKHTGELNNLDESEEINACSINVKVKTDSGDEDWLLMFKNETHNHPTEIEPFGGAATCLGGAIRDPLSGRAYVYQAMRVTGAGNITAKIEDTIPGKLPQRKISIEAAHGYSSYGNQIGLATGHVAEIFDDGYVAKRMEVGAVMGAVKKENVRRETPLSGDVIILLGGRTGRDGIGGATGSSKEHNESSLTKSGAEVQKGNPVTERKIQRFFKKPEITTMIKKCNDFGAGGVCVAIGELADGLVINLDLVPKKYEGLDGTELAISESQERMAVVIAKEDKEKFIAEANEENLEAVHVADVTDSNRLVMHWKGNKIIDICRNFLNSNGAKRWNKVKVTAPEEKACFFDKKDIINDEKQYVFDKMSDIKTASQKGLVERFDSSIGASTVLMPFGGKYQLTPEEIMAAKLPVSTIETSTASVMSWGYNPEISKWSPYYGAVYAVMESITKLVIKGVDYKTIRMSFQEYFERLNEVPEKWGKPFSALLGALKVQKEMGLAAIGGKDSMSGTFNVLNVPPTLISFAVSTIDTDTIISSELKSDNSNLVLVKLPVDDRHMIDFGKTKVLFDKLTLLIGEKKVLSSYTVKHGGIIEALCKMSFGNKIGFRLEDKTLLTENNYGSFILEISSDYDLKELLKDINYIVLGNTVKEESIFIGEVKISIDEVIEKWTGKLEDVFPTSTDKTEEKISGGLYEKRFTKNTKMTGIKPKVFIPAFPGTNCEFDSARAFRRAGAEVEVKIFNNLNNDYIDESIKSFKKAIDECQILMLPGGFSAGDEPDGSAKFITAVLRNPVLSESLMNLIKNRDGLIIGICNGFQALIKLGLVPYGEIKELNDDDPTLTYNRINRHVSQYVNTKIISALSPWFSKANAGDIHAIPVSHGEGRFVCTPELYNKLLENGQIATQYVDIYGNPSYETRYNPNGSYMAVEGITSEDGRILGKMGHSERTGINVAKNIPGNKNQLIFESGVEYFKI